ncbi:cation-transporting P-type ATPase [Nitrosomonas communis]|uniref:Potassium and/or sodium efflux P-type ATPase n=1 Tax=Nitrosomonas communis TaxID=44574 RepID=A0A1I4TT80_9PROT|nr:cation-transporting P-type ATPase [Nitrosomonas communis]SFM79795.1 potassium and/or sodium efflux P-type ATPase [Nitrosomonas communis]
MATFKRNSETAWHNRTAEEVMAILQTSRHGLTQTEAEQRLKQHGPNRLKPPRKRSAWSRFLLQFHNMLIYVLLASAMITALLGHWVDTAVIVGVVLINALIGFIQEGKAEKALNAIRQMLSLDAMVLRDGKRIQIRAEELVPGDIVLLQSGDKVPADLRLFSAKNLRVEEAALTGESEAIEKTTEAVPAQVTIGDRLCMTYSSTLVVYGQSAGIVVATADQTEIGRISAMLERVDTIETPLLRQLAAFGHWLSLVIIVLAVCMLSYGMLLGDYHLGEMFLAAVSIAVAAIPEGLPAIMTITLALGVQMMAKRHAIIRRLPAVETLGAVTVICTDKTGTLTRNEMTVQRVITADYQIDVSGIGYAPVGGFSVQGTKLLMNELTEILELFRIGLLCNDAQLREHENNWTIEGDPTEGALITLALKVELDPSFEHESLPRTDAIPFESEHRFMATLHHDHAGHGYIYLKGAPEEVLAICTRERSIEGDRLLDNNYWQAKMQEAAALGQRLLAIAVKTAEKDQMTLTFDHVRTDFTLLGLVGIMDPARKEAIEAVQRCRSAGIHVKMITGDHIATARAIGMQLGIGDGQMALSGVELDQMDDAQLREAVSKTDVFARASPEHKLRLVKALQSNGEIVAMTGDGVNDAPALKRADIGVAMGKKGTEVAKEASEMVITDDNFASITHAVEEGRTVYDNIKKTIVYIMPTSGGEAGMLIIAILLGMTLPISPVQILWVNMVTAVTLSLSLAFEKAESGIMQRPPRDPSAPILSRFMIWRIAFVSLVLTGGGIGLFLWEQSQGGSIEACRTIAVNALVMGEIWYLFNCRYLLAPVFSYKGFFGNPYVLLAISILVVIQLLFTYHPLMQQLFGTAGIDPTAWTKVVSFGVLLFLMVEVEKYLISRYKIAKI